MQQYSHKTRRSTLALLLLLLLPVCVSSTSLPQSYGYPALLVRAEETTQYYDSLDAYEKVCGEGAVKCVADGRCCFKGYDCYTAQTNDVSKCLPIDGTTPSTTPSSTAPPPESKPSKSNLVGPIVGGVLGFVILVGIGAAVFLLYRRKPAPSTPAIPAAPMHYPHMPGHMIEAKYPPASDSGFVGDTWHPGSYLYNNRNRSMSVDSNGRSMSPYDNISPGGFIPYQAMHNRSNNKMDDEIPHIVELPESEMSPSVELPADGYFGAKDHPLKDLERSSGNQSMTSLALAKPAKVFTQFWRRSSK